MGRFRPRPWLLLPVVLLAIAGVAMARGGGGGGFGGGGDGGGGGGDGDGGSILWLVYVLIRLCVEAPVIGIPLLVIVVLFLVLGGGKANRARQGRAIRRGIGARREHRVTDAIAHLKAADPAFDGPAFLARVRAAFLKVQDGWCGHDLSVLRPFVSDGIHERFALQITEQKDLGYRDRMEKIEIQFVTFEEAYSEGPFDVVTVSIPARAADYRVSLDDGKYLSGSREVEAFVEYWSFLRRRGARTVPGKAGLLEGNCPNCGAAVEMNQWSNCVHCRSLLRSGEHDWVLVEITQASVWTKRERVPVPGLDALRARDPALCLQHLEDRVSVMFWRSMMADRLGRIDPLRKIAGPEYAKARAADLADAAKAGSRTWHGECAVGSVTVLGLLPGTPNDRAVAEVVWEGSLFTAPGVGPGKRGPRDRIRKSLFVLERDAQAVSRSETAVSSAHCPGCGAPETGGDSNACEYCGAVLADGSGDWVLAGIHDRATAAGRELLEEIGEGGPTSPPVPAAALGLLVKVATADGAVTDRERARIRGLARKAGMPESEVDGWIEAAATGGGFEPARPGDDMEARAFVSAMASVALSDGRIDGTEMRLIDETARASGISRPDTRRIVADVRRGLMRPDRR